MRSTGIATLLTIMVLFGRAQQPPNNIPHLIYAGGSAQLWVDGRPMLLCGGELGNSSASSMEYMRPLWSRFVKMHLNTPIPPVYCDVMEHRDNNLHLPLAASPSGRAG